MKTRARTLEEKLQQNKKLVAKVEKASNALNMVDKYSNNFMYSLEAMASTNDDYKIIKDSFEKTTLKRLKVDISKIYRVRKRLRPRKSDNLLLFHGTNRRNAVGILEGGFMPSTKGKHGRGVYLTDSSYCAVRFSRKKSYKKSYERRDDFVNDSVFFIFVNEIFESESLEEVFRRKELIRRPGTSQKNKFIHYIKEGSKHSVEEFSKDSSGKKIKSSAMSKEEMQNYYVCHEELVVPRYLIQCFRTD